MLRRLWVFVALWLALAVVGFAKERVWTSSDGRQLHGEFVRELDGEVTLLVEGKLVTLPLDRLSERDQQAARDLAAGKEVADDPPAASETEPGSEPASPDDPPAEARVPTLVKRPPSPVNRVWTDNQGRKTTGKFVRVFNGRVVISRAGGPIAVAYFDLTEADQQYVQDLLTARGEEALIPIRPPPMPETPAEAFPPPGGALHPQPSDHPRVRV